MCPPPPPLRLAARLIARYPWEDTPAAIAPSAHISRILPLPADLALLSAQDFDVETLFSEETSPDLLPSLIKSLILPAGLHLRLRALHLAGKIAESLAGQIAEAYK